MRTPRQSHHRRRAGLVGLLILLAACNDAAGPEMDWRGTVRFAYAGTGEGSFAAQNHAARAPTGDDMAAAFRTDGPRPGGVLLMAVDAASGGGDAIVLLSLPELLATGDLPLEESCENAGCAAGSLILAPGAPLRFTSGVVRVSHLGRDRLRGTFAGTARHPVTGAETSVLGGAFDVPLSGGAPPFHYAMR